MNEIGFIEQVENCLNKSGIEGIHQIEGMSITEFFAKYRSVLIDDKMLAKLIDMGIIIVPDGEVAICQLNATQYLKNCLYRADMNLLSDIRKIPIEKWFRIRNLGVKHRAEVLKLCDEYGVQPFSLNEIQNKMLGVRFTEEQLDKFFYNHVFGPEDLFNLTCGELEKLIDDNKAFEQRIDEVKRRFGEQARGDK